MSKLFFLLLFSCFVVLILWGCIIDRDHGTDTILFVAKNESSDTVVFSYYGRFSTQKKGITYEWLEDDTILSGTEDTFVIMLGEFFPSSFPTIEESGFYIYSYNTTYADSIQVQFLPSKRCVGHSYGTSTAPRGLYNSTSYNRVLDEQRRITTFIYTFTAEDIKTAGVCQ